MLVFKKQIKREPRAIHDSFTQLSFPSELSIEDKNNYIQQLINRYVRLLNNVSDKKIKESIITFAKLHVEAALKEAHNTCKLKFIAGETGYLAREDIELIYPLNLIK